MTSQELERYAIIQPAIRNYINENMTKFIVGDRSLNDWDAYVKEFDKLNVKELLKIVQAAYDRTVKNSK